MNLHSSDLALVESLVIVVLLVTLFILRRENRRLKASFQVNRRVAKLNATYKNFGNRLYSHLVEASRGKDIKLERVTKKARPGDLRYQGLTGEIEWGQYLIIVYSASSKERLFNVQIFLSIEDREILLAAGKARGQPEACKSFSLSEIEAAEKELAATLVRYTA